jgi:DNA-directed RNA polymerase specialized sigma24 family protein
VSDMTLSDTYTDFVRAVEPRLGDALVAALGPEVGREATQEALVYAWEHWTRVGAMDHPAAYLYRVGRSKAKRYWRKQRLFPDVPTDSMPMVEPGLAPALVGLSEKQRVTVLLIHGFGWTHAEVAEFLGVAVGTVQKHLERGMASLRSDLEVDSGA